MATPNFAKYMLVSEIQDIFLLSETVLLMLSVNVSIVVTSPTLDLELIRLGTVSRLGQKGQGWIQDL